MGSSVARRTARRLSILVLALVSLGAIAAFAQTPNIIAEPPVIHGNRRIPAETIKARVFTHAGDVYDPQGLERDFNSLWNTGYFEDLRFEREETPKGWVIHIYVKEKPTIREIHYEGLSAVSQSDVLDRFKERKVGLSQESQYDPTKVKKAEVTLKELLSEHGRQFATIRTEVRPIPPAAVAITFNIKEGPKVKVGKIKFEGNKRVGSRYLRYSMRNLRPIGIPHSIFLENIFSKTYDATKLNEDTERIRMAYQAKGYFKAIVENPKTQIRDTGGFHIPLVQKGKGKAVDLTIPVEEGALYRLAKIEFTNNKAIANTKFLRSLFAIKDGDIFNRELIAKGLENLRKAYGEGGYINFTPIPDTKIDEDKKLITLIIDMDEGKPFYVRRIEFAGNTTTRDKVIRRELALEEGNVYNSKLWEFSVLRLNQLGYFENLKPEEATERHLNEEDGTVDLTLKVKEKGKNSIGLTGGVSGLSGSFIGIKYSTNNFLGLGETLSVAANLGNLQRDLSFGFTEPYAFDRPLQLGFTVFTSKYNFNQAKQFDILSGQKLNLSQNILETLQNFSQATTGFTLSASYPLKRSLKRLGLTYSFDNSSITTFSTASQQYFEFLAFRQISGPNALQGIVTSKIVPSFTVNTINHPMQPHWGHSFFVASEVSGLGGSVRTIRPIMEYKQFIPMKLFKPTPKTREGRQTLGYRIQTSFLSGWGGVVAPPFQRFYIGGDNDVRGFDVRSITPYTFITNKVNFPLTNPDGTPVPLDPANPLRGYATVSLPVQQIVFTGGDTSVISNLEYRIPIAGPVTVAIFNDVGVNAAARQSQLRLSSTNVSDLNNGTYGCGTFLISGCVSAPLPTPIAADLKPIANTNWVPRMSTGVELQVLMPVINAPLRIYWAYNPLRLDTFANTPLPITRSMFPPGGIGDFSYQQAVSQFAPAYLLREPRKTFRFSVSTTF